MRLASNRPRRRKAGDRKALVLILVLIVVLMVSLAGFTFAELMLTEEKATRLQVEQLQLQQSLRSGEEYLKQFLEQPAAMQLAAGGTEDNPAVFRAIGLRPETPGARVPANQVYFSIVTPVEDDTPQQPTDVLRFGVENESGRLHLGDLLRFEKATEGAGREALMQLPGMTEDVADSILDWIDDDSVARPLGAESDYYDSLPEPYAIRNGLPDCLEELLLVKGVTRELLFGADSDFNRQLEPEERALQADSPRTSSAETPVPWSWLLTIYSAERNLTSSGHQRINLNGADLPLLHKQLSDALGPELAAFVTAYRQFGPLSASASAPGQAGPPPVDLAVPPTVLIISPLDLVQSRVAAPGSTEGYASPLGGDPQSLGSQLAKLQDLTTVSDLPVLRGLVSVNHAPAQVLEAVPGIDEALAQKIVAARKSADGAVADRRFATWLLTEGLVDLETMKRVMPFVTGGGDVVRAQIVAHSQKPLPTARAETIIDATTVPARQLMWRDLRFHGLGFPREVFAADTTQAAGN